MSSQKGKNTLNNNGYLFKYFKKVISIQNIAIYLFLINRWYQNIRLEPLGLRKDDNIFINAILVISPHRIGQLNLVRVIEDEIEHSNVHLYL